MIRIQNDGMVALLMIRLLQEVCSTSITAYKGIEALGIKCTCIICKSHVKASERRVKLQVFRLLRSSGILGFIMGFSRYLRHCHTNAAK